MKMREKFEILAKLSGWEGNFSSRDSISNDLSTDSESSISELIDHVTNVLEKREITCVELNRSLERQQLELEASREQLNLTSNRMKEMKERFSASESNGIELNSKISSMTAKILTLEQGLKREKSQSNWTSNELQKTLDDFASFRKEQSIQMAETRSQSETVHLQAQETQNRLQRSLQSLKEREKQISSLQEQVASLRSQLSANEVNFTREMNSTSRMIELYKNASEDATERISILQIEIEELRETLANSEAQVSGHSADLEAELEDREGVIKVKEEQLERMRVALDGLLKVAKVSQSESEPLSLTADILNEFATKTLTDADTDSSESSTVSIKQIYAEYSICRAKLARAEEECSHLRLTMQEMVNEINSKSPMFESLQYDNSRLQGDVAALTEQLIKAASSRDTSIGEKVELKEF